MHQTLKHQIKNQGTSLIRLWELFDEAVRYEEDPSGVHAGLVAIKTKKEDDYKAYEVCKRQIESITKGTLKVNSDKAIKIIQTLFLYHVGKSNQSGLSPEEIANSVLIEKKPDSDPLENIQHYEDITDNLKKELRQVVQNFDEDKKPKYKFNPEYSGIDPRIEFQKAKDDAEGNEKMQNEAWEHLLSLDEWPIKTRQMIIDLTYGTKSIFRGLAKYESGFIASDQTIEINWKQKMISGVVSIKDLSQLANESIFLQPLNTEETDYDFGVYISKKHTSELNIQKILNKYKDSRIILWTPAELTSEEKEKLIDFAAYRKLINSWQGKDSDDAITVVNWCKEKLQSDLGRISLVVNNAYSRGRFDANNNLQMDFRVAGELTSILSPIVSRVLESVYESRIISFTPPLVFRKEEGVKVINGIVKTGEILKGMKKNQNTDAAQNFGFGLKILKRGNDKKLDTTDNPFLKDIELFVNNKIEGDGQSIKVNTIYKNFLGIGVPKSYGLSKRIVQIYLLCLVREGKIRLTISNKSGLNINSIDYSNIADIEFSAKILDNLSDILLMEKPENWEVLHPYAEKILNVSITKTSDDAEINNYREKLRDTFKLEKEESNRVVNQSISLFDFLKIDNPYKADIEKVNNFFNSDIEVSNDIDSILYALKTAFEYKVYDIKQPDNSEIDDLSNVMTNYHNLKNFIKYDHQLRVLKKYIDFDFPETDNFKALIKLQMELSMKVANIQQFIDSEEKLKTQILGNIPANSDEHNTLGALIRDYALLYSIVHNKVFNTIDNYYVNTQELIESSDFKVLKVLERISILKPIVSNKLINEIDDSYNGILKCANNSEKSIQDSLKNEPYHVCKFKVQDADTIVDSSELMFNSLSNKINHELVTKAGILISQSVKSRLESGKQESVIEKMLSFDSVNDLIQHFKSIEDYGLSYVDIINKYLKTVKVKKINLTNFKPTHKTIEEAELSIIIEEFKNYLESEFNSLKGDNTEIPILQFD